MRIPRRLQIRPAVVQAGARRAFHTPRVRRQEEAFHAQLEDPNAANVLSSLRNAPRTPQTLTEKIVQRHCQGLAPDKTVKSGDYVTIRPYHCMTHDNSWPVAMKFMSIGATEIEDKKQLVMTLDHDVQNHTEANLKKYRQIEGFAKQHGVDFYPAGRGIGHQIMVEQGYAWPGSMTVASDSHSNMYGGVGCLGTAIVRTDAVSVWSLGATWWKIPPIAKVTLTGQLPAGVTGKDVIVALCGLFSKDEVLNHAIEFAGSPETMASLSVDDRLTIANMTTEWGALTGLFPIDSTLHSWLEEQGKKKSDSNDPISGAKQFSADRINQLIFSPMEADRGAKYAKEFYLDLSTLSPYVSGPNSVKVATPLPDLASQGIPVNRAYLVSCTNSRASDLAAAAKVFKDAAAQSGGRPPRIAKGVDFYVAAASLPEQHAAEESGDWQALIDAGAQVLPAGCGPCIGLGTGLLQPGEVGISASNRNFKGRMGSTEAKAYLASPEVVAASALSGKISGPGLYEQPAEWTGVKYGVGDGVREDERMLTSAEAIDKVIGQLDEMIAAGEKEFGAEENAVSQDTSSAAAVDVLPGFPRQIEGEIVFCDADNINTDAIYPGKLTYQDHVTPEQMAAACMQNYDPSFATTARPDDILVTGFNFGCGSSREQAATAILAKKIPLVVAGSFGSIFSRNSINNALMGLEVPRLVERLRQALSGSASNSTTSNTHTSSSASSSSSSSSKPEIREPSRNKESLDSPPPAPIQAPTADKPLTRRTGWRLKWDVARSQVEVQEGDNGPRWTEKVGELPATVQEVIAKGGLERWIKARLAERSS